MGLRVEWVDSPWVGELEAVDYESQTIRPITPGAGYTRGEPYRYSWPGERRKRALRGAARAVTLRRAKACARIAARYHNDECDVWELRQNAREE